MEEDEKVLLNPSKSEINKIMKSNPSICYNCERARIPASLKLRSKGYVGCTLLIESENFLDDHKLTPGLRVYEYNVPDIVTAEGLYTGWVKLSVAVFGQDDRSDFNSGVSTNCMLMTRKCTKCKHYRYSNDLVRLREKIK